MADEDLYREIEEQEAEDDARFKQRYAINEIKKVQRKEPDYVAAQERYEKEIRPVIEARARVESGLPITDNPLRNAWLRLTGKDKIVERPGFQIVEPSKGLILDGPTIEEVQKEIAANPEKYRHLAKIAPEVNPVEAKRKTPQDLYRQ